MSCWTYRNKFRVSFMLMIILTLMLGIAKILVGYKEKSLSLIAGSFHLIMDVPALIVGYLAFRFSNQQIDGTYTFGRVRSEILGAMINMIFLVAICFSLTVESLKRLFVPDRIENPEPVLIVGLTGLVVNTIGLVLFRCSGCGFKAGHNDGHHLSLMLQSPHQSDACQDHYTAEERRPPSDEVTPFATPPNQLNIQGVFLHILQHVFVALIVVTSALIVMFAKGRWTMYVDPGLSLVVVVIVLRSSLPVLRECVMTLMQTVPADLQLQNMEERLLKSVPEVEGVHELHIWQLAGNQVVGSAHIVFHSHKTYNAKAINRIQQFFIGEGISSLTVQPEFSEFDTKGSREESIEEDCLLVCAERKCAHLSCCATPKKIIDKLTHHH